MSLKTQTISLAVGEGILKPFTMPSKHFYPFIIHRSIIECVEKSDGRRIRYSHKHCVSHLFSGGLLGVFASYLDARAVIEEIKDEPLWLMPTPELLTGHTDWEIVSGKIRELKKKYCLSK